MASSTALEYIADDVFKGRVSSWIYMSTESERNLKL